MIKALQKRFITTAMVAVTFLLIFLLGIINITNTLFTERESDRILDILSITDSKPRMYLSPREIDRKPFSPPPTEDSKLTALYFTAKANQSDEIEINLKRISSISEEKAIELTKKALQSKKDKGKTENFKFKTSTIHPDGSKTIIFLDITTGRYKLLQMLGLSSLAGMVVWLIMLLFVTLLSKRAIFPIARNFEKQKQFVTDAGHEIKTPLAIILANTEALELHTGENKWSKNIKMQITRLDGLMKNLLTLAKSDEENTNFPREEVDVSELISSLTDMFLEPAALRKISLEQKTENDMMLISNKEYITRLISTLIDNAVKYAKPESTIFISAFRKDKHTEITIKNECEFLPCCEPEKLFDRFYREDFARTQKSGGYGIGLSAARAIASILGGSISAKYDNDNSIIFTVKL